MIHFDEPSHTYTNIWGEVYTSSTTLVSRFKPPFESLKIATAYAKKHGQTPEYWMAEWDRIRDHACERGTAFHKHQEHLILAMQERMLFGTKRVVRDLKGAGGSPLPLDQLPDGLYVELLLWNHDHKIAGQADLVGIETDPATGLRYIDIDDHKTNGRIDCLSYYVRRKGHRMMLPPLGHLQDCNRNHYELQLSIYAWMLEQAGYLPRRMQFTHYKEGVGDPMPYPVDYRRKEVEAMLPYASGVI